MLYFLILGICPFGGYCSDGKSFTACPRGTFNNKNGSTNLGDCKTCPAGYYCPGPGVVDYSPYICEAGYYCPPATQYKTQFPCPAGTYNSEVNKTSLAACLDCPATKYCIQGTSTPSECPKGYYCPIRTGESISYACPIGTYSGIEGLENATQCIDCPVGHYCPDGSNLEPTISPTACLPGTYNNDTKSGHNLNCKPCEPGRSCPVPGLSWSNGTCQVGHYCPAGTVSSDDYKCPPGTYTNETNLQMAEQCLSCPKGFSCGWGTGFPDMHWQPCKIGHFCPEGVYILLFFFIYYLYFKLFIRKTGYAK